MGSYSILPKCYSTVVLVFAATFNSAKVDLFQTGIIFTAAIIVRFVKHLKKMFLL